MNLENYFLRLSNALSANQSRPFFSSFNYTPDIVSSQFVRDILLHKTHKLRISQNLLTTIFETCESADPHFSSPINALVSEKNHIDHFCSRLVNMIYCQNHELSWELFIDFKSWWLEIVEEILISHNFSGETLEQAIRDFDEFSVSTGIMRNFNTVKNENSRRIFISKRCVCHLYSFRKMKIGKICEVVPLTRNQIKKH